MKVKSTAAVAAIALACLVGCGIAIIDENPGTLQNDGWTTATQTTTATTTATQTTATATTTQTETGTETGTTTATEPPVEALLFASLGPIPVDMTDGLSAGSKDSVFQFNLTAGKITVKVSSLKIKLESQTGGKVVGSKGTPYFTGSELIYQANNSVVAGPIEISAPAGSSSAVLQFQDSFMVFAGTTVSLVLSADVSATEDVPGEFLNGAAYTYNGVLLTAQTVAINEANGLQLLPSEISPNADLVGVGQLVQ